MNRFRAFEYFHSEITCGHTADTHFYILIVEILNIIKRDTYTLFRPKTVHFPCSQLSNKYQIYSQGPWCNDKIF